MKQENSSTKKAPFWMRTRAFRKLCKWSFDVCDRTDSGEIDKTELYAGLLLVHLNLAKYAGPAACYPPDRTVVENLFDATDDNNSGGIDEDEFRHIMIILCSEITFRLAAYYSILILLVPYLVWGGISFLDAVGVDESIRMWDQQVWERFAPKLLQKVLDLVPATIWETMPETLVSMTLFYIAIPSVFNWIDSHSQKVLLKNNTAGEGREQSTTEFKSD